MTWCSLSWTPVYDVYAGRGLCATRRSRVVGFARFGGDYSPKSRSPSLAPSRKAKRSKSVRSWLRS